MDVDEEHSLQTVETLDELRARVQRAKAQHASLQADIDRLRTVPTEEEVAVSALAASHPLPPSVKRLSKEVALAEDRCILHRTSAWTVFEIDLDVGRRERQQRREQGASHLGKASLGLGVRIDTFWRGRFHEPYYLVFAKKSQLLAGTKPFTEAALDVGRREALRHYVADVDEENAENEPVRLVRHTIPHFIPLQILVKRYLGRGGFVGPDEKGGLELLDGLMERQGLLDFLGHLHSHLQAFVSRREQAVALRVISLPTKAQRLEAFGNDGFDHLTIHWTVPDVGVSDIAEYEKANGIDRAAVCANRVLRDRLRWRLSNDKRRVRNMKRNNVHLHRSAQITVRINDLMTDRPGKLSLHQPSGELATTDDAVCLNGAVRVEEFRHVQKGSPKTRRRGKQQFYKGPTNSISEYKLERKRRPDMEAILADPMIDLDQAIQRIIETLWREEVAARSEYELTFEEQIEGTRKLFTISAHMQTPLERRILRASDDEQGEIDGEGDEADSASNSDRERENEGEEQADSDL